MKVLVFGATGGTGLAVVEELLRAGHEVTAFVRSAARFAERRGASADSGERLFVVEGDVARAADVERAVRGQDAVVVTLGISENPLTVRLRGARKTPMDVRSLGTRHIVEAMRRHGVKRLVVQTTYGVGDPRDRLRLLDKLFFALLLRPQIADTERQDREVKASGLDWVLARPVHLTDADDSDEAFVSTRAETRSYSVSRRSVARFLARAVESSELVGELVALSGARAA